MKLNKHILVDRYCRACLKLIDKLSPKHDLFESTELAKKFILCSFLTVETQDGLPKYLCDSCHKKLDEFYQFQAMCYKSFKNFIYILSLEHNEKPTNETDSESTCVEKVPKNYIKVIDSASVHNFGRGENKILEPMVKIPNFPILPVESPSVKRKLTVESPSVERTLPEHKSLTVKSRTSDILMAIQPRTDVAAANDIPSIDGEINNTVLSMQQKQTRELQHPRASSLAVKSPSAVSKARSLQRSLLKNQRVVSLPCKSQANKSITNENVMDIDIMEIEFPPCVSAINDITSTERELALTTQQTQPSALQHPRVPSLAVTSRTSEIITEIERPTPVAATNDIPSIECEINNIALTTHQEQPSALQQHTKESIANSKLKPLYIKLKRCSDINTAAPAPLATKRKRPAKNNTELFHCTEHECDKFFKRERTLFAHLHNEHKKVQDVNLPICDICKKVFPYKKSLSKHSFIHKDKSELPYGCTKENCDRRFSTKDRLDLHLMRHVGIKNYVCTQCGIRKMTYSELAIHMNEHTLERTWPCHLCSHVSLSAFKSRRHLRVDHEQGRDYACRYCEKTFLRTISRKYHERIHTGEKPHICKECGRGFSQPTAMHRHELIHQRKRKENTDPTES